MMLLKQNDDYKQEISRLENNISALKREIDDQKQFTDKFDCVNCIIHGIILPHYAEWYGIRV